MSASLPLAARVRRALDPTALYAAARSLGMQPALLESLGPRRTSAAARCSASARSRTFVVRDGVALRDGRARPARRRPLPAAVRGPRGRGSRRRRAIGTGHSAPAWTSAASSRSGSASSPTSSPATSDCRPATPCPGCRRRPSRSTRTAGCGRTAGWCTNRPSRSRSSPVPSCPCRRRRSPATSRRRVHRRRRGGAGAHPGRLGLSGQPLPPLQLPGGRTSTRWRSTSGCGR